jgi:hypothetical protein
MIVDMIQGDVLDSNARDILFTIHPRGSVDDAGLAAVIASRYWTALGDSERARKVGVILTHDTCKDEVEPARRFHALVTPTDPAKAPAVVEAELEDMNLIEPRDPLAFGLVGFAGAKVFPLLGALARTKRRVVVYTYF